MEDLKKIEANIKTAKAAGIDRVLISLSLDDAKTFIDLFLAAKYLLEKKPKKDLT